MARAISHQTALPLVGRPLRRAAPLPNGTVKTAVLLPITVRRSCERFCKEHNVTLTRLVLEALVAYVGPQEESRDAIAPRRRRHPVRDVMRRRLRPAIG